jgi:hypothetical protein
MLHCEAFESGVHGLGPEARRELCPGLLESREHILERERHIGCPVLPLATRTGRLAMRRSQLPMDHIWAALSLLVTLFRSAPVTWSSNRRSDMINRPPGRNTRSASWHHQTSKLASGNGSS